MLLSIHVAKTFVYVGEYSHCLPLAFFSYYGSASFPSTPLSTTSTTQKKKNANESPQIIQMACVRVLRLRTHYANNFE